MYEISVNEGALKIVEDLLTNEKFYRIKSKKLSNNATVIDMGVEVSGGYHAGLKLGENCLGGYGTVVMSSLQYNDLILPMVVVTTEYPHISCLGSQFPGWRGNVKDENYFAMISGPLIEKKFASHSLATALANKVFPVPGGPYNKTPFGGSMPIS